MKLSYNWLKDYVALDKAMPDGCYPSPERIAQALDNAGIPVEGIHSMTQAEGLSRDDVILEINIPREFSSYSGMMWTANELCGLFHVPFDECETYSRYLPDASWEADMLETTDLYLNSTTNKCSMIAGRIINRVQARRSPAFIRDAVLANGYSPVDTLRDIPIYVARNLGQPCCFLDADHLPSLELTVEEATAPGVMVCEGNKCFYYAGDLVLMSGSRAIGLYGYLYDDEVTANHNTTRLLIVTLCVEPEQVSSAVERFGINNLNGRLMALGCNRVTQMKSLQNATSLLYQYSGAALIEPVDILTRKDMIKSILGSTVKEINELLSTRLTYTEIVEQLVNGNMTAFVKDVVYHEGRRVDVHICKGSPYVTETHRIGSKFGSYRNRRQPCDLAQCLLGYLGCERIGERTNG